VAAFGGAAFGEPADRGRAVCYPAEFERLQAVWMQWPPDEYNSGQYPVYPVVIKVAGMLEPYVRINLLCRNQEEIGKIKDLFRMYGYSLANISFWPIDHLSIWARDVGPTFVRDDHGHLRVVDFGFSDYGKDNDRYYIDVEGSIDRTIARELRLPIIDTFLVSEGGAVESNGKGTIMITEAVALSRNPHVTKDQIESEYKRVLGVKKVIWLKQGLIEDDRITGGHVDEIARFADPNTILLATVLPSSMGIGRKWQENYRRLEENYRILSASTDQDGRPFRVVRIPVPLPPGPETDDAGQVPVRSYLNYAVANGAVLMPAYWKPGRPAGLKALEEDIQRTFRRLFPGRRIITVHVENVNRWGGGIHCLTQYMPA